MQNYLVFSFQCPAELSELLTAELSELGFEGFMETEDGFEAYLPEADFSEDAFQEVIHRYKINTEQIVRSTVAQQNWNEQWESNFEPVIIAGRLGIRAPFHKEDNSVPMELIIQPKTSFGTGHHETTASLMELMLDIDFANKTVFDFGAGTGILSVLAIKLGAASVFANDIDPWAIENIQENLLLNQIEGIDFASGDMSVVPDIEFDCILANINRNILQENMGALAHHLKLNGLLLISGFYESDLSALSTEAHQYGLLLLQKKVINNWTAAVFRKGQ